MNTLPDILQTPAEIRRTALYSTLMMVPAGYVVTYGQLAEAAGLGRAARWVGRTLSQLPDDTRLPWHRVLAAEDGSVTLANGEAPKTVALASIQQIIKPKPLVEDLVWKGNVDVAMDYKRADKDTDDYDLDFKTTARHGAWRHHAEGEYNREFQNDVVTTDNWTAEYALDYFISDKWYWQGRLTYNRDRVEDISRQRTVGTGPGYQFWDDELGAFSLGSLLNRTDYEYSDGKKDNFYSLAMKWDYNRYLMGKTVSFFTNGELGKSLEGESDYSLDSEIGLRYKVTEWASLNLKAEKDLIGSSTGSDNSLNKTRYTVGFGVVW